jgi:hypothetical protein
MNRNLSKVLLAVGLLVLASLSCSALSALGSGALLEDDFSKSDSGWGTGTDSDSSVEYANGGLQMQLFTKNYFIWSTPNTEDYDSVHMEVTVNTAGTDSTTAFGFMCYQQAVDSAFYYFAVTPAGEYAIVEASIAVADVFLTNNDEWGSSDLIATNAASYRLGADCGNGTLTLYVDGKQIVSVSDSTYTRGGVGLFTWSGEDAASADVTFDDFVMTKLGK